MPEIDVEYKIRKYQTKLKNMERWEYKARKYAAKIRALPGGPAIMESLMLGGKESNPLLVGLPRTPIPHWYKDYGSKTIISGFQGPTDKKKPAQCLGVVLLTEYARGLLGKGSEVWKTINERRWTHKVLPKQPFLFPETNIDSKEVRIFHLWVKHAESSSKRTNHPLMVPSKDGKSVDCRVGVKRVEEPECRKLIEECAPSSINNAGDVKTKQRCEPVHTWIAQVDQIHPARDVVPLKFSDINKDIGDQQLFRDFTIEVGSDNEQKADRRQKFLPTIKKVMDAYNKTAYFPWYAVAALLVQCDVYKENFYITKIIDLIDFDQQE